MSIRLTEELADRVRKLEREYDHNAINAEIAELDRQSRDSENKAIYNEAPALLRRIEPEEWLPQRDKEPELPALDPVLNAEFIAGLITGLAFSGLVAGALYLGARL